MDNNQPIRTTRSIIAAPALEWLAAMALVALLSWGAREFTRGEGGVSTIWLANGLLLGIILAAPRARCVPLLLAGFVGNFVSGMFVDDAATSLMTSLPNALEVYVASLQRRDDTSPDLTQWRAFRRFMGHAVLLGPVVAAACHAGYMWFILGHPDWGTSATALVSHSLGMATFAPITLALWRDGAHTLLARESRGELLMILVLVAAVTALVFSQSRFPLLFLTFPAMLLMAMRGGFGGTAVAMVIVVLMAVIFTVSGAGPLSQGGTVAGQGDFFILQVFIASLLLTMFPIVVVLAENQRAQQAHHDSALQLGLLAEHATDVIVLTDTSGRPLFVSSAVKEVFGYDAAQFRTLRWQQLAHPEDVGRVEDALARATQPGARAIASYRAYRRDGSEIWIEAICCAFRDESFHRVCTALGGDAVETASGGRHGRVITLRDITARRSAEDALSRANAELAALVTRDALTGLANRRCFDEALDREAARCRKDGTPLSVIMIDVDHFKAYNDALGHQQGDRRLIKVGRAITTALTRSRDIAVRYGGEEFAVILPGTTTAEAGLFAERIRLAVLAVDGAEARGPLRCSVSLGVAGAVPGDCITAADIVKAADDALYTSKREGRNRATLLEVKGSGNTSRIRRMGIPAA